MDALGHLVVARRAARRSPRQGILAYLATVGPATAHALSRELEVPMPTVLVTLRDEEYYSTVDQGHDLRWRFR